MFCFLTLVLHGVCLSCFSGVEVSFVIPSRVRREAYLHILENPRLICFCKMLGTMFDHHVSVAISSQVRLEPRAVVRHVFHMMESIAVAWLLLLVALTVAV